MSYVFFEPTQDINSYIDSGDTDALRGIIVGVINRDPTFATKRYDETLDYISKRLNIWDDELVKLPGEFELPREKWDKEYFRKQLAWLSQNFNRDRVRYIEDVGKHVYANENTWGKEEAGNFYHPVPQKKRAERSQGVIGGLIMVLLVVVIIATVVLLVPGLPSALKIILIIVVMSIVMVCVMAILKRRRKHEEENLRS